MSSVIQLSGSEKPADRIGRGLYRKQILRYATFAHPNDPRRRLDITPQVVQRMVENFNARRLDFVPVPSGHTDSWEANKGEVLALTQEDDGAYAVLRVDDDADEAIVAKRLRGVSAAFSEDYLDKESGQRVGPTLRHVALTNVPYIKNLKGFESHVDLEDGEQLVYFEEVDPVIGLGDDPGMLPAGSNPDALGGNVTVEEAKAALKAAGIDVDSLSQRAARFDRLSSVRSTVALSEAASDDEVLAKVVELSEQRDEWKAKAEQLEADGKLKDAERMIAPYLKSGKVQLSEKDELIELGVEKPKLLEVALKGRSGGVMLSELGSEHSEADPDAGTADDVELSEAEAAKKVEEIRQRQLQTGALREDDKAAAAA